MRIPRLALLALAVLALALAAMWSLLGRPSDRAVPAVELRLIDGSVRAAGELRGHPTVVSFWSLTCAPCVKEIPDFARLYRELHAQGLQMIAIAMPYDPPGQVVDVVRQRGIPYPVAVDVDGSAARAYGVDVVPRLLVFDREGRTVLDHRGPVDMLQLSPLLRGLLTP